MALEELKAQISLLIDQMVDQSEDAHEIQERIREKLNELRAMGLPLPADLVELEKKLDEGFDTSGDKA
jgi:predicted  nucleic acid-binding Zn-ribbon protein